MLTFPPDGTFLIQLASFFVLLFILKRLLFEPFQELLTEREERTLGDSEFAVAQRAEVDAKSAAVERDLAVAREQAMSEVDAVRRSTKEEEASLFATARQKSDATLKSLRVEIASARTDASKKLGEDAQSISASMVDVVLNAGAKS
jgi:F-type H+-transporting ATPase subunit b